MKVKPIKPKEAALKKVSDIPDGVIKAFNTLIVKNLSNGYSQVTQKDAVNEIVKNMGCDREDIFNKNWLDIESHYRKAGWKVKYDKPGYNESYEAFFEFRER